MIFIQMDAAGRAMAACAGLPRFTGRDLGLAGLQARLRPAPVAITTGGSLRTL